MLSAGSIFALATSRARELEALAMPRACLGCERQMPAGDDAACCALCRHRMRPIAPPVCARCGQPRDAWSLKLDAAGRPAGTGATGGERLLADRPGPPVASSGGCPFCREWPEALAWAVSAVWLEDGPARNLAHALKYGGWSVAAPAMAERIVAVAGSRVRALDALVPIPLGRTRERERGHNQAALLAEALGSATGVPVLHGALRRTRETRSQTRLSPADRRRNVLGAFGPGKTAGPQLEGLGVGLVDDVLTTGATLGAAAVALAALGPATIGALTFARAVVPS